VSGITTTPNIIGTVRGSNRVPNVSPSADAAMHASGASVSSTGQLTSRSTSFAGTTAAIGNTSRAASSPWIAPDVTFPSATSATGSGARTRSSISFV
jgi:hypothetical protein